MSLIQEALEKAGRSIEDQPKLSVTPPASHLNSSVSAQEAPAKNGLVLIFGVLIFLGGLIAYHLLTSRAQHSSPTKDGGKTLRTPVEARMSSIVPNLLLQARFTLTGITISGDERLALINNQVVGVGDRIGEKAFVKEIQERRVILEFQGREVNLAL